MYKHLHVGALQRSANTQINVQLDVAANATQFTYSNNEWRRITAGFNLLLDRKNDEITGDNFYGLEVGSTEEVPMSDGIQDVDGKYATSEGKTGCRSGIDEIKNERNSVILDR